MIEAFTVLHDWLVSRVECYYCCSHVSRMIFACCGAGEMRFELQGECVQFVFSCSGYATVHCPLVQHNSRHVEPCLSGRLCAMLVDSAVA